MNASEHHALLSNDGRFTFAKWLDGAFHETGRACAADVTGDGYADAVALGVSFAAVVRGRGTSGFGNTRDDYSTWSPVGLLGTQGTFVADADGDLRADVIAVFRNEVRVARSSSSKFEAPVTWLKRDATEETAAFFAADVDGDGLTDLVAVRQGATSVSRSTGSAFLAFAPWRSANLSGREGTYFADVDGDGRADGVRLEADGVWVARSNGQAFTSDDRWFDGAVHGSVATFVLDADGDGRADVIAVNPSTVRVALSNGTAFSPPVTWYVGQFRGDFGITSAPAPGGACAFARGSNIGVYRDGRWLLRAGDHPGDRDIQMQFGDPGDDPVAGEWNGDGTTHIGLYRPSLTSSIYGFWHLRGLSAQEEPDPSWFPYGAVFDLPVVGDWDGDGTTTIGIFRPQGTYVNQDPTALWYLRNKNDPGSPDLDLIPYGAAGDLPVVGDWDGDGETTIGLFRPPKTAENPGAEAQWFLRNDVKGAELGAISYGIEGDIPVVGDWDGNGTVTIGVFRSPGTSANATTVGEWRLRNSNSSGPPDMILSFGSAGDRPVVGRWAPPD